MKVWNPEQGLEGLAELFATHTVPVVVACAGSAANVARSSRGNTRIVSIFLKLNALVFLARVSDPHAI